MAAEYDSEDGDDDSSDFEVNKRRNSFRHEYMKTRH